MLSWPSPGHELFHTVLMDEWKKKNKQNEHEILSTFYFDENPFFPTCSVLYFKRGMVWFGFTLLIYTLSKMIKMICTHICLLLLTQGGGCTKDPGIIIYFITLHSLKSASSLS